MRHLSYQVCKWDKSIFSIFFSKTFFFSNFSQKKTLTPQYYQYYNIIILSPLPRCFSLFVSLHMLGADAVEEWSQPSPMAKENKCVDLTFDDSPPIHKGKRKRRRIEKGKKKQFNLKKVKKQKESLEVACPVCTYVNASPVGRSCEVCGSLLKKSRHQKTSANNINNFNK